MKNTRWRITGLDTRGEIVVRIDNIRHEEAEQAGRYLAEKFQVARVDWTLAEKFQTAPIASNLKEAR